MKQALILTAILSVLLVPMALADEWNIDTVDNEGNAGEGTRIYLDATGNPGIVYLSGGDIYEALWTESGWDPMRIPTYSTLYNMNHDVVTDTSGFPHVSYQWGNIASSSAIFYNFKADTGWSDYLALGGAGAFCATSIALDSRGNPHVVGSLENAGDLGHWYVDSVDGLWKEEQIVDNQAGFWCSMAIDSSDHIYVAYNTTDGHLRMAYYNGTAWGSDYVDLDDDVGEYCDLILDDAGVPHIAYYDATNTRLKYATLVSSP